MSDLRGVQLAVHLDAVLNDYKEHKTIYGYSADKFYYGFPGYDFSVDLFGKKVDTPLGPAAGPHTQLAQNILLSFLHGSRIIELKTIQKLDELDIPRPCIDIRNIGYNVEWSQELSLEKSYEEYVKAWILIHIIRHLELLGKAKNNSFYNTVFDISVGYDLEGISSPQVERWIQGMMNAHDKINELLAGLPQRYAHIRKITVPDKISDSVTLSTFHGCPGEEIEDIVKHLISKHHLNVVVKMNPTLAGFDFVQKTLHNELGYSHIQLDKSAFDNDLNFAQAVAMMKRLRDFAKKHGVTLGAKFTNTLVVENSEHIFTDEKRYLSGSPLYVLAMHLVHKFRQEIGADFPLSFSGGINRHNFSEAVACGLVPVTTCTDILKKGGYSRLTSYLQNLKTTMEEYDTENLNAFILKFAKEEHLTKNAALLHNAQNIARAALQNPEYHFNKNSGAPKKINSELKLFDCLSCNICLPVCPNAATFSFEAQAVDWPLINYRLQDGKLLEINSARFKTGKATQIGIIQDFCNSCGNCDTFCPEHGGPYLQKPRFFIHEKDFLTSLENNSFYFYSANHLAGRFSGEVYHLKFNKQKDEYRFENENFIFIYSDNGSLKDYELKTDPPENLLTDSRPFLILRLLQTSFKKQTPQYHKFLFNIAL